MFLLQAANDAKAFPVNIEPEPAISPPVTLKTDLYTDVKHFEKLDRQAIMVGARKSNYHEIIFH